jgi:hypothetical protein
MFKIISTERLRQLMAVEAQITKLRAEASKLDAALNSAEISPNGDDYNRLCEIVAGGEFKNDIEEGGR